MPTMESITNLTHFSLFKGEPGVRKSTAALSYPKPQYWFDFDGKMNALTIPMKKWGINPAEIEFDSYTDWTKAAMKLEQFRMGCKYKTIVVDSITSCADYMLRQVQTMKGSVTRGSGQQAGKVVGGIPVSEIEDFNAEASGLTELIALLKDIKQFNKLDVVLIAHVIRIESKSLNGDINVSRTIVTAGKKPAAKIPAYCDETYHFSMEKDVDPDKGGSCIVLTEHVGEDYARTTLPLKSKLVVGNDPLYDKFIKPAIEQQTKG